MDTPAGNGITELAERLGITLPATARRTGPQPARPGREARRPDLAVVTNAMFGEDDDPDDVDAAAGRLGPEKVAALLVKLLRHADADPSGEGDFNLPFIRGWVTGDVQMLQHAYRPRITSVITNLLRLIAEHSPRPPSREEVLRWALSTGQANLVVEVWRSEYADGEPVGDDVVVDSIVCLAGAGARYRIGSAPGRAQVPDQVVTAIVERHPDAVLALLDRAGLTVTQMRIVAGGCREGDLPAVADYVDTSTHLSGDPEIARHVVQRAPNASWLPRLRLSVTYLSSHTADEPVLHRLLADEYCLTLWLTGLLPANLPGPDAVTRTPSVRGHRRRVLGRLAAEVIALARENAPQSEMTRIAVPLTALLNTASPADVAGAEYLPRLILMLAGLEPGSAAGLCDLPEALLRAAGDTFAGFPDPDKAWSWLRNVHADHVPGTVTFGHISDR
jgi:hypothetical protein